MTGQLIVYLLRLGLPERLVRRVAPYALAALACALLALLAGLWVHFHDQAVVNRHEAKLEAAAASARVSAPASG